MARCWSCGSDLAGGLRHIFTCPLCVQVEETKKIRGRLESSGVESLYGVIEVFGEGFEALSAQLADIASILEWGFEEINWRLDQISETLDSIDRTLKSPATTRAREWRRIAEELRRRKVLDKSKKFFLKSLDANPLDYRTYIGLGKTYLELGAPRKARFYWKESLPHAPKGEIDYKSYTYRLLGRLDFCEDNLAQALSNLQNALTFSPHYPLAHYDYAQYCSLIGDEENSLKSLETAIVGEPFLLELARREKKFNAIREKLLGYVAQDNVQKEIQFRMACRKKGMGCGTIEKMLADLTKLLKAEAKSVDPTHVVDVIKKSLHESMGGRDDFAFDFSYSVAWRHTIPWPQLSIPVKIIKRIEMRGLDRPREMEVSYYYLA